MTESMGGERPLDPDRMIVLSLKPRYAGAILSGAKTVELRRIEPKLSVPMRALIYASTPVKALLGTCIVERVTTDRLAVLWKAYGSRTGLAHAEFRDYFEGLEMGSALALSGARRFGRPIPLADLRTSRRLERPPQSFSYVDAETGNRLLQMAA